MAIDKILYVLTHSKAKKSHQLVLLRIANRINSEGLAWPSYATLASETGLSRRHVIRIVADLQAVGELEILPEGSPYGTPAYRIPGSDTMSPGMKSRGDKNDTELVTSCHPNQLIESLYRKNDSNEEEAWLTPDEAVRLGLSPGSRLYQKATGELLPEE
jgi:hypothetical protein